MTPDQIGQLDPEEFYPLNPGASDPAARLADMDAMGVDVAVVFPTLFAEYLPMVDNPVAAGVLAQAYNDWIWDFAAATDGRVHPVAILPLQSVLLSLQELERVAAKGFRSVLMRPGVLQDGRQRGRSVQRRPRAGADGPAGRRRHRRGHPRLH